MPNAKCPTCHKVGVLGSFINCGCTKPEVITIAPSSLRVEEIRQSLKQSVIANREKQELPIWQKERYEKCRLCVNYLHVEREEQCGRCPEGRNYIWRRRGIPNPKARCPIGEWEQHPSPVSENRNFNAKKLLDKVIPQWHFITVDELARDIQDIIPRLPPISGVASVPVSGGGAWQIASALHVPWYEASVQYGLSPMGHGLRGGTREVDNTLPILILDDTASSGYAMRKIKQRLGSGNYLFMSVYAKKAGMHELDYYGTQLEEPHLLEWNLANSGYITGLAHAHSNDIGDGIAFDMDGVICKDPPRVFNERDVHDRQAYLDWLAGAPLGPIVPRMREIPLIVSYRCEYTRELTEVWLAKNGVKFKELRLWPDSVNARPFDGKWKADAYTEKNYGLFIESDHNQAKEIARISGKRVLCTATRKVY